MRGMHAMGIELSVKSLIKVHLGATMTCWEISHLVASISSSPFESPKLHHPCFLLVLSKQILFVLSNLSVVVASARTGS